MGRDLTVDEKTADVVERFAEEEYDGNVSLALRKLIDREMLRSELNAMMSDVMARINRLENEVLVDDDDEDDNVENGVEINTVG